MDTLDQTDYFLERRVNHARRARVSRMTKQQLIRELYTDHLTGLPNGRAYQDSEKREIQVMLDVDSLKWVNDNLGYDAGDALLRTVAMALESCGVETYRVGGDEFMAQFDEPTDVIYRLTRVQDLLRQAMFSFADKDGKQRTFQGIEITYGTGSDQKLAEKRLTKHKLIREQAGTRTPRGVRPYRMVEVNSASRSEVLPAVSTASRLSRPVRQAVVAAV